MKKILFVCVENSCRSQMAEGFARHFGKDIVEAYSAGSHASGRVNPLAVSVMNEAGVDISSSVSKGFDALGGTGFDIVITMGCKDVCPFAPSQQHIDWRIDDPKGKDVDFFRKIRDDIKLKVQNLIQDIRLRTKGERVQRHFEDELNLLKTDILRLATLTEEAIYKSIEALKNQDVKLAQTVIEGDKKIDELELAIEERAIDLLALQQPVARDLRFITTGMKINAELERIADLSENIAQRVLDLQGLPLLKPLIDIPKLADIARTMVKDSIDAFVSKDEELAKKVIHIEEKADALRNLVQQELVEDYLIKDGTTAPRAIPLFLVARHLERICDHASYIANDVIYMISARVVKHHPEKLGEQG